MRIEVGSPILSVLCMFCCVRICGNVFMRQIRIDSWFDAMAEVRNAINVPIGIEANWHSYWECSQAFECTQFDEETKPVVLHKSPHTSKHTVDVSQF